MPFMSIPIFAQELNSKIANDGVGADDFKISPVSYTHLTLPTTPYV